MTKEIIEIISFCVGVILSLLIIYKNVKRMKRFKRGDKVIIDGYSDKHVTRTYIKKIDNTYSKIKVTTRWINGEHSEEETIKTKDLTKIR